jgi:hypothetical protein
MGKLLVKTELRESQFHIVKRSASAVEDAGTARQMSAALFMQRASFFSAGEYFTNHLTENDLRQKCRVFDYAFYSQAE